jgi:hypothetical protein
MLCLHKPRQCGRFGIDVILPRQSAELDDRHARRRNGSKMHLGIVRPRQCFDSRAVRHDKPDHPATVAASLQDGRRHGDLLTGGRRLRDRCGHRDALLAGVATEDVAGEQPKALARGILAVTRHRHFRRNQGRIVTYLEFALGRLDGKLRLFGGHDGGSQQVEPEQQGKEQWLHGGCLSDVRDDAAEAERSQD